MAAAAEAEPLPQQLKRRANRAFICTIAARLLVYVTVNQHWRKPECVKKYPCHRITSWTVPEVQKGNRAQLVHLQNPSHRFAKEEKA